MRICLIGGIFDKSPGYRAQVQRTPETTLAAGLMARGHTVATFGHHQRFDPAAFDVVHVHHLGLGAVAAATMTASAPLVFTSHAFRRLSRARTRATAHILSRASASVVLSDLEAAWQREHFPSDCPQYVIPNGVDQSLFGYSPPPRTVGTEPWRLLYVGQLTKLKGVEYLLRALPLLPSEIKVELDLVYHIDQEEANLRALASQLGLDAVRFLGVRTPVQLAALYAGHHVLVLPSLTEALPTVIAEAILVGRPVVASDVGGIRTQVGSFGETVPPRSPEALAAAITRVLRKFDTLRGRSREASQVAAKRYSVAAMIDAHQAVYRACPQGASRHPAISQRVQDRVLRVVVPIAMHSRRGTSTPHRLRSSS